MSPSVLISSWGCVLRRLPVFFFPKRNGNTLYNTAPSTLTHILTVFILDFLLLLYFLSSLFLLFCFFWFLMFMCKAFPLCLVMFFVRSYLFAALGIVLRASCIPHKHFTTEHILSPIPSYLRMKHYKADWPTCLGSLSSGEPLWGHWAKINCIWLEYPKMWLSVGLFSPRPVIFLMWRMISWEWGQTKWYDAWRLGIPTV